MVDFSDLRKRYTHDVPQQETPRIVDSNSTVSFSVQQDPIEYTNPSVEAFWPTPMWKFVIPNTPLLHKMREYILGEVTKVPSVPRSNFGGWQSPPTYQDKPVFKPLVNNVLAFCKKEISETPEYYIESMWLNVNRKGACNQVHIHEGSLTGIFYVQTDEKTGGIGFCDPRIRATMADNFSKSITESINKGYHPTPGMGLIFPTWVEHYTQINESDKERISISFNIDVR